MSTFGARAAELAGLAGAALGWSPDAFWRATPAELAAVVCAAGGGRGEAAPPDAALIARLQREHPDG